MKFQGAVISPIHRSALACSIGAALILLGTFLPSLAVTTESLSSEIAGLNKAITAYKRAGGTFSDRDDVELVVSRLRYASQATPDGAALHELQRAPVLRKAANGQPWAIWNPQRQRFELGRGTPPEDEPVIVAFADSSAGSPITSDTLPTSRAAYAPIAAPAGVPAQLAVAGFAPAAPPAATISTHARTRISAASTAAPRPRRPNIESSLPDNPLQYQLDRPVASHPGGRLPLAEFTDLTVTLANPNGELGAIQIRIDSAPWGSYQGDEIPIAPGTQILAYCESAAPEIWDDSGPLLIGFEAAPTPLPLTFTASGRPIPVAALASPETAAPLLPVVGLEDGHGIPIAMVSGEHFKVRWTCDGSDPLDSETAGEITDFAADLADYPLPLHPSMWPTSEPIITLRAIAVPAPGTPLLASEELQLKVILATETETPGPASQGGAELLDWYGGSDSARPSHQASL